MTRGFLKGVLAVGVAGAALVQASQAAAQTVRFDLPAGPLAPALDAFMRVSGAPLIYRPQDAQGARTRGLQGEHDVDTGLERLLAGTELRSFRDASGALVIAPQAGADASPATEATQLTEIVVTGSRIRGANPTAPVSVYTQLDIQRSGQSQLGDFLRTLPQNFGGGQNPTVQTGAAGSANLTNASTVNLRGLGPDATLVLLNGRRLVADGAYPSPDISAIPLAALARVEVVTDGASALYGADAVAGVVNFILRDDYDGAEASVRLGGTEHGGGEEQTYNVLVGDTWDGGRILLGAEYRQQDSIRASQRAFTSQMQPLNNILQASDRKSAFFSVRQSLGERTSVGLDGLYAKRRSGYSLQLTPTSVGQYAANDVWAYSLASELTTKISDTWSASLEGTLSRSLDDNVGRTTTQAIFGSFRRNELKNVEFNASGALLQFGDLRFQAALGGGYREESYSYWTATTKQPDAKRDVRYAFAELSAPIFSAVNARPGLRELELSAAARIEDYSDFGSTTNPKVGIRWSPFTGAVLRGTWGTSFKAPSFTQLMTATTAFLYRAAQVGASGSGTALMLYGGNQDLGPEESESITIGFDVSPRQIPGLKLAATYFEIDYKDRVVIPITATARSLLDPRYSPYVLARPNQQQAAAAIASVDRFQNLAGVAYDPAQLIAIIENRQTNAAAQKINGVDLSISQAFTGSYGRIGIVGAASFLDIKQRNLATFAPATITGTLFNPAERKVQIGASWAREGWDLATTLNYVSGGLDTNLVPVGRVSSWTTLDLTAAYAFENGWARGAEISLSVLNALDKNPPVARGAALGQAGVFWDSTQTSPIGRSWSITARKSF